MSNISQESIRGVDAKFESLVLDILCRLTVCVGGVFCLPQLPVSASCSLNAELKPTVTPQQLWLLPWEYLPLSPRSPLVILRN